MTQDLESKLTIYRDILNHVTAAAHQLVPDDVTRLNDTLTTRIHFLEVSKLFGGILTERHYGWTDFFDLDNFVTLRRFGKGSKNQTLSLDTMEQPKDGWYLYFQFSTGAYLLNTEYIPEVFDLFWNELVKLRPAYTGTLNKEVLFTPDQACEVYKEYKALLIKYREIAAKRERLLKKLAELKCDSLNSIEV